MITTEALAKHINNDPQFNVRILKLLSKATLPITVNELIYWDHPSKFLTTCTL